MDSIRSFIAVDLATEVLNQIERTSKQLQERLPGTHVRWVPAKNIHLTLKFLGEVSPANLPVLYDILQREAGKLSTFEIGVGGIGAFPDLKRPRVIWIDVQAPPVLLSLQQAIDGETARLGYASEGRRFSPHLTLGRIAHGSPPPEVRSIGETLAKITVNELGRCWIKEVHFYRSDLGPAGARYTRLYSARLLS